MIDQLVFRPGGGFALKSALFEDVPDPADGLDEFSVEGIIDLSPQPPDGDIDNIGVALEVHVPYLFRNECSREHLA